ncbi:glycosyltransferase family 2 protein [Lysobacter claricitrinus]|uniref:glycosyltransferase family 2 protein n=1 Tax=Lysobacter claricitrinus TaxID=3367728 RepID=UPI0037DAF88A
MTDSPPPWLSVLVPARNVAPWLADALGSILGQADAHVELLVLDDASTDTTFAIASAHAARDPRVRVLGNTQAQGVAWCRNHLIENARGEYCWFVDADDQLARGAMRALRSHVDRHAPDLVLCDYRTLHTGSGLHPGDWRRRVTFEGPRHDLASPERRLVGLLLAGQLHAWSKIARRECWSRVRFDEGHVFEDVAASLDLAIVATKVSYVAAGWIRYRQREGSLVQALDARTLHDRLRSLEAVLERTAGTEDASLRFASAYYRARGFAWLARRLEVGEVDASLRDAVRRSFRHQFPDRAVDVLDGCRRRGWHLRARRLARDLEPWFDR